MHEVNNKYSDNYVYINQNDNSSKTWTNNYRGMIIKSVYEPKDNHIHQFCSPYNYINRQKPYFEQNKTKNNNFNAKIVNRTLELTNIFN